jgi:hypothetical protein
MGSCLIAGLVLLALACADSEPPETGAAPSCSTAYTIPPDEAAFEISATLSEESSAAVDDDWEWLINVFQTGQGNVFEGSADRDACVVALVPAGVELGVRVRVDPEAVEQDHACTGQRYPLEAASGEVAEYSIDVACGSDTSTTGP